ncbi:MAG: lytic transglycosylase domain-containing protein [Clostridia bacterium]|nr:lytic transglycosylase domain-containing protein [Clostridia bacterium]
MRKFIKFLLLLAVVAALVPIAKWSYQKLLDRFFPLKYEGYIEKYSEEYKLDKYLVMAVIRAESSFDHAAHSGVARGLMQITDDTARWIAEKLELEYHADMVEDPETNIKMGCYYLSYLRQLYKNTETALAAYNAGMGNVSSWLGDKRYSADGVTLYEIPYGETKRYVQRVKKLLIVYQKLY